MPRVRSSSRAGAYQSPQLLMLSGIGPAETLPLFQIEVRQDLPVGDRACRTTA